MILNLNGLLPICSGVYLLLVLFRVVRINKDAEANELWLRKYGRIVKVACPIIIVGGILQLLGFLY